jgi:Zn-dependent M28 family amino/carboxypeptidase
MSMKFQGAYRNIIAEREGRDRRVVVIGAHYDTATGTPGADDNASGVAVLLELVRLR